MESLGKAAVAEFVATFALIFMGAGAVILSVGTGQLDLVGVALAHGLVLAIMVSVTGHISGGLVNPAVTIALWTTGKISTQRGAVLIVAQMLGAVVGALLVRFWSAATSSTRAAPARRRSDRTSRSARASSSRRSSRSSSSSRSSEPPWTTGDPGTRRRASRSAS